MGEFGTFIISGLIVGIISIIFFELVLIPSLQEESINFIFTLGHEMIELTYSTANNVLPSDIADRLYLDTIHNNGITSLNIARLILEFIPGFGIGGIGSLVLSRR